MSQEVKHYYYLCGGAEFGLNYYTGVVLSSLPVDKIKKIVAKKYGGLRHLGSEITGEAVKFVPGKDIIDL